MRITINDDTTFLISNELGNIPEGAELGLYQDDTRFLSRYELRLNDEMPLPLAAHTTDYYAATNVMSNPALPGVLPGVLSVIRQRFVGHGMHEDLDVINYGDAEAAFTIGLLLDADFAHIYEVKHAISVEKVAIRQEGRFRAEVTIERDNLRFGYQREDFYRQLVVGFSIPPEVVDGRCRFNLRLAPRQSWHLCINFLTFDDHPAHVCNMDGAAGTTEHRELRRPESVLRAPRLESDSYIIRLAYTQSVADYAALQIKAEDISNGDFTLAAGIPWFMALFGRDSLIAAYQSLPFYPLLAKGVLRTLARFQGTHVDRLSAEEPGKILHEHRSGGRAQGEPIIPTFPYYGTVDATPLFLILLAAVHRTTGDLELVRSLRDHAGRALEWIERYGDRDGDGYLEYILDGPAGLENQGWKDSHDSVRFRDGSIARPPIALCEAQGYAYAARLGFADILDALGEPAYARRIRDDAADLKARFNRDFWLPEQGFYAEALDGDKRKVDALTSNVGHLLWSGIADDEKARQVADRLLSPEFFSGWGIRTMASTEVSYNPISYHNGSVWPHDNSLIVAGLARYGFVEEAAQVVDGLLAALAQYADHRLPELFAGYGQHEIPFVVEYPTASRPQAWASGSVFLLLSAMLGRIPQESSGSADTQPFLPTGVGRLRVEGIVSGGKTVAAEISGSGRHVNERIADVDGRSAHSRISPTELRATS